MKKRKRERERRGEEKEKEKKSKYSFEGFGNFGDLIEIAHVLERHVDQWNRGQW